MMMKQIDSRALFFFDKPVRSDYEVFQKWSPFVDLTRKYDLDDWGMIQPYCIILPLSAL